MRINDAPIVVKFLAVISLLGLVAIMSAAFSADRIHQIADGYTSAIDHQGTVATRGAGSNRSLEAAKGAIADLVLATSEDGKRQSLEGLKAARSLFSTLMQAAINADQTVDPKLKDLSVRGIDVIDTVCKKAVDLGEAATTASGMAVAQAEYLKSCQPAFQPLTAAMTQTVFRLVDDQEKAKADLALVSQRTITITFAVIIGGSLAVSIIGIFAVRAWISRPIIRLSRTMQDLAHGALDVTVMDMERRDEVGEMAKAVQVFKSNGLKLRTTEKEASEARRVADIEREKGETARAEVARQQATVVASLADGLARLSQGDLVFRLNQPFATEYEKLRADFNAAISKLQSTMTVISGAASALRSGTMEISTAAGDLSRRTEQQAASLEETAAALDEITATVKKTANGASHANAVVSTARSSAERSSEIVSRAVEAMRAIEGSSQQIGRIIGVIDEIAFQTNLLALNAGVEAARAGEAGRGFAVVASEVRALAQRSAEAAKEIKALISTSAEQVGAGVGLVGETGDALERIAQQVMEINTIVSEIAASAQEQSVGLEQVNTAINQMDQVTQQNAAMVEESTAASRNLATETEELARLVGQFQVSAGSERRSALQRPSTMVARQSSFPNLKVAGNAAVAHTPDPHEVGWEEF